MSIPPEQRFGSRTGKHLPWVNTQSRPGNILVNATGMKTTFRKKPLTFGDFVVGVYEACGKRRARGIVRLAIKAHLIEFLGPRRFVIA